jgi:hypothetical protein
MGRRSRGWYLRGTCETATKRAALDRMRKRAEQLKLGCFDWSEWKAYRDEGRP